MRFIILFVFAAGLMSCQSAVNKAARDVKYSAYEMVGYQKRDLYKREVGNVKDSQEETGESLKDALDRLKEFSNFDGGNLEKKYRSLNSSYEDSQKKADEVHRSIQKLDTVAQDLFVEWQKEAGEISSKDLQSKSLAQLSDARKKYQSYAANLQKSSRQIDPVLKKLKDQVLFLKHNLNQRAITGLKTQTVKIQGDIESLIGEMNKSIQEADEFIKTIEKE